MRPVNVKCADLDVRALALTHRKEEGLSLTEDFYFSFFWVVCLSVCLKVTQLYMNWCERLIIHLHRANYGLQACYLHMCVFRALTPVNGLYNGSSNLYHLWGFETVWEISSGNIIHLKLAYEFVWPIYRGDSYGALASYIYTAKNILYDGLHMYINMGSQSVVRDLWSISNVNKMLYSFNSRASPFIMILSLLYSILNWCGLS